jgi:hypothetical protein
MTLTREELWNRYGRPTRLDDDADGVIVFDCGSEEAAEAYAEVNRVHHGHPSWVENRFGVWVNVVDLRPALPVFLMNEQDRVNQDEYAGEQEKLGDGLPRIEPSTHIIYLYNGAQWEARWPTTVRLPMVGERIVIEGSDSVEKYEVDAIDWVFNADNNLRIRISLK